MLLPVRRRLPPARSCGRSAPTSSSPRRRCSSASSCPTSSHPARGQFVPRLDSPVNKLQKLTGQPKLDAILRHPRLALDRRGDPKPRRARRLRRGRVVRRGLGQGAAPVHPAHGPPRADPPAGAARGTSARGSRSRSTRPTCCSAPTFARMLAMDRSAGLECVAAWQSLGQIEDRDLRSVILNLLRHRFVFSLADDDAREIADMLQTVYADVIRDDQPARARMRITPDALMNLPNFHAACSWIADGARVAVVHRHRRCRWSRTTSASSATSRPSAQRGAHYPGPIPPPNRLADYLKVQDLVPRENRTGTRHERSASDPDGGRDRPRARRPSAAGEQRRHSADQARTRADAGARTETPGLRSRALERSTTARTGSASPPLGSPVARRGTRQLHRARRFDEPDRPALGDSRRRARTSRRCRAATTSRSSPRCTSCASSRLPDRPALHGRPRRCARSSTASTRCSRPAGCAAARSPPARRGHNQRVYALAEAGYELIQANRGRTELARHVDPDAKWRAPEVEDPRLVAPRPPRQRLAVRARATARARTCCAAGAGPRSAMLDVPAREGPRPVGPARRPTRVPLGTGQHLADLALDEFEPVKPDLAVELDLSLGDQPPPRRPAGRARPLRPRLLELREVPPLRRPAQRLGAVATALQGARRAAGRRLRRRGRRARRASSSQAADRIMTGRVGKWGVPEAAWPHYGRRRIFVVAERDVHQGTLRAQRLPEHPPALRKALSGRGSGRLQPEQVASLLPTAFLR